MFGWMQGWLTQPGQVSADEAACRQRHPSARNVPKQDDIMAIADAVQNDESADELTALNQLWNLPAYKRS